MRLLLLLVGGALLVMLIKRVLSNKSTGAHNQRPQGPLGSESHPGSIDMVQCRHCQVHLAVTDAISSKEGFFCSTDHLDRHRQRDVT